MTLQGFWADQPASAFQDVPDDLIAVLPIGAIEQHGPHLPLSVDRDLVEATITRAMPLLEAGQSVLVLPTLTITKSGEHVRHSGTLSLSAETLLATLRDIGASIARAGVQRLVLLNGHGGNNAVLEIVARDLRIAHELIVVTCSWSGFAELDGMIADEDYAIDLHAGDSETSAMLAAKPELVDMSRAKNFEPAMRAWEKSSRFIGLTGQAARPAWIIDDLHPEGACGNASAATVEKGEQLLDSAARNFVVFLREFASFDHRGEVMTKTAAYNYSIPNVRVPLSLVADPSGFGEPDLDCLRGDLQIEGGKAVRMVSTSQPEAPARMVLPKLTEAHVHLDKCHTISRVEGVGGDLQAAIDAQAKDRLGWTSDDIRNRASRGLDELIAAGCGTVRTHVDWGLPDNHAAPSQAWPVIAELAEEHRNRITLQVAPLTGIEDLADAATAARIAKQIADKGGVLGSFVYGQPDRQDGIRNAFAMAEKYGLALDFHVDEGLENGLDGLAMIADTALETGFQGPVLCGHACSLMNLSPIDLDRLAEKLAKAGISIVSLPSANLYLQGRTQGTPDRRGVTRIRELQEAGVQVVVGTDNVRDAFCPLGRFDPRQSLALATLAAHLDPPFGRYLPMITTSARAALGLAPTYVDGAAIGDLIQFDAETTADLLGGVMAPAPLTAAFKETLHDIHIRKKRYRLGAFAARLAPVEVIDEPVLVKKRSRDFFWYSPILNAQLKKEFGDLVAVPKTSDEMKHCLQVAYEAEVPVVLRGGGTGNYGQCVPVDGGVIIDATGMNRILEIGDGFIRAEAGALMADMNAALKETDQEMAMFPSTQDIATVGGFVAGGSVGIGSLATGALREPGNLMSLKAMSIEAEPQEHLFEGADVLKIHHAWGLNGVITEVTLRTVPTRNWIACMATFDGYEAAYSAGYALATAENIAPKMASVVDAHIVDYFPRLKGHLREGHDLLAAYVPASDMPQFRELIEGLGGNVDLALSDAEREEAKIPHVFEFCFNHTTLQVLKSDRSATYQQVGVPDPSDVAAITRVRAALGDDVWTHHEFIRLGGEIVVIDLPIIWFSGKERLDEINQTYQKHGFAIYEAHNNQVERGGLHAADYSHLAWKKRMDPKGLLNSSKSTAWDMVKDLSPEEIEAKKVAG